MSLYRQHREQVKKSILDTSTAIFMKKGYDNTTVDEITRDVGIAKGTFYNFYSSKGEVLMAWGSQRFREINMQGIFDGSSTLEENLYKLVEILVETIGEDRQLFGSFLREILKVHGDSRYKERFNFLNIYRLMIEGSKDGKGVLGFLPDVKIDVLNSSLFMGMINWFDAEKPVEGLAQYLKNTVRVCLYGLLNNMKKENNR